MKQLFFFVVLIIVLGIGGFVYRYVMERPTDIGMTACTTEARICPDGSSVGRSGPDCSFAACPSPNFEVPELGISFVVPNGYTLLYSRPPTDDYEVRVLFYKNSLSVSGSPENSILISRYDIPAGQTADEVILANTRYQPADMQAEDFSRFTNVTAGGKMFRATVIERFEALVMSSYFLARENDVLRFDIVEHDVTGWMDADLVVADLPEHAALLRMLGTLQTN